MQHKDVTFPVREDPNSGKAARDGVKQGYGMALGYLLKSFSGLLKGLYSGLL